MHRLLQRDPAAVSLIVPGGLPVAERVTGDALTDLLSSRMGDSSRLPKQLPAWCRYGHCQ
jgi:hypothetical protein